MQAGKVYSDYSNLLGRQLNIVSQYTIDEQYKFFSKQKLNRWWIYVIEGLGGMAN